MPTYCKVHILMQFSFWCSSRNNSLGRDVVLSNNGDSQISATSSVSSLSIDSWPGTGKTQQQQTSNQPIINGQLHQTAAQKNEEPKFLIIRVTYETLDNVELDGVLLYKSILLYNSDRTSQVVRNAMMKLDLEGEADRWTLVYCLPDKEMVMQPNTNVFYAVDKKVSLNFLLRPKKTDIGKLI